MEGPIRNTLTPEQERRVRVIHEVFLEVFPISLEETFLNFRRDIHPEDEIRIWEYMAEVYKSNLSSHKTEAARKKLFASVLTTGKPPPS
jgi:hypothetical protein